LAAGEQHAEEIGRGSQRVVELANAVSRRIWLRVLLRVIA
jgi:hypothetical protein